jgi:thiamine-phosphate pyrophosphorylase
MDRLDWSLCLVADTEAARGRWLPTLVEEAVGAGAGAVQLRAKTLDTKDFFELAGRLSIVLKPYSVPLIINDRLDIAMACGAQGVHLGQRDLPIRTARALLGPKKLIGCSVSSVDEAREAQSAGADYLGAGPIYFTSSKKDLPKILGTEGLRAIKSAVRLPVLAVGGINAARAGDVAAAGADGLAVISAVLGAEDVAAATKALLSAFHGQGLP